MSTFRKIEEEQFYAQNAERNFMYANNTGFGGSQIGLPQQRQDMQMHGRPMMNGMDNQYGSHMYQDSNMAGYYGQPMQQPRQNEPLQFDMSNFPALGSTASSSSNSIQGQTRYGQHQTSGGLSSSMLGGHPMAQVALKQEPDFSIHSGKDFPSLPSTAPNTSYFASASSQPASVTGTPPTESSQPPGPTTSTPSATAAPASDAAYGLMGLLDIMTDKDLSALALGSDLASFGLNLNSAECLYSSFLSPFVDQDLPPPEPTFSSPPCYMLPHAPVVKTEHLSKLQLESLFYMFYSMPKDLLQMYAAQELYRRDWKFHGDLRIWLKPSTPPATQTASGGIQFVFFDINTWEAKPFHTSSYASSPLLRNSNVLLGLLTEDDLRGATTASAPGNTTKTLSVAPQPLP